MSTYRRVKILLSVISGRKRLSNLTEDAAQKVFGIAYTTLLQTDEEVIERAEDILAAIIAKALK